MLGVGEDFAGVAFLHHLAVGEDDDAGGEVAGEVVVVGGDDEGAAAGGELAQARGEVVGNRVPRVVGDERQLVEREPPDRREAVGRLEGVAECLAEAAPLCGIAPPEPGADSAALRAKAAELRALLGEARPRWRAGR